MMLVPSLFVSMLPKRRSTERPTDVFFAESVVDASGFSFLVICVSFRMVGAKEVTLGKELSSLGTMRPLNEDV